MKRFFSLLLLSLSLSLFTLTSHAFEILDEEDGVWVMDADASDDSFSWTYYSSVQTCLDELDIEEDQKGGAGYAGDIVLHYKRVIDRRNSDPSVYVTVLADSNTDDPTPIWINWRWKNHPHVYFLDYYEDIWDTTIHPHAYQDFILLCNDEGYIDPDDESHEPLIVIAALDKLQVMVDNARVAWGLAKFPNRLPPTWHSHIQQRGGDWVKYGEDVDDYYIANVDIAPSNNFANPTRSAYFRKHNERRYSHTFDDNDIKATLNFSNTSDLEINDVFIDYRHDIVNIKMANGADIVRELRSLTGLPWVSFESGSKWYIAQVRSANYAEGTIILTCVAKAKKGNFSNNESLAVGIEQINDDDD